MNERQGKVEEEGEEHEKTKTCGNAGKAEASVSGARRLTMGGARGRARLGFRWLRRVVVISRRMRRGQESEPGREVFDSSGAVRHRGSM